MFLIVTILYCVFQILVVDIPFIIPQEETPFFQFKSEIGKELLAIASVSHFSPEFCIVLRSAIHNKVPMMILNLFGSREKLVKISQYYEFSKYMAEAMPEKTLLFMDGFDVLFQQSGQDIMKKYRSFNKSMLFMVEKNCWPMVRNNMVKYCQDYPRNLDVEALYSQTKYEDPNEMTHLAPRFINSGIMMARPAEAVGFFEDALKYVKNGIKDDQEIFNYIFTSGSRQMYLDYYSTLFQSMYFSVGDMAMDEETGLLRNKRTNVYPSLLHFNGDKSGFKPTENTLWYHQEKFKADNQDISFQGLFLQNGSFVHYGDACPELDL
jgi:hypothetical protein